MNYKRRCKHCGKWIQLRLMPHGQWVAFEGYDTPHECIKQPIQNKPFGKSENANSIDDIDFAPINVPPGKNSSPKSISTHQSQKHNNIPHLKSTKKYSPALIFWSIIIAIIIIYLILRNY